MPHGSKLLYKPVFSISCNNHSLMLRYQSHALSRELHYKVIPLTPLQAKSTLSNEDIMRYSRQLLLPELGVQGTDGCCVTPSHSTVSILPGVTHGLTQHDSMNVNCPQVS